MGHAGRAKCLLGIMVVASVCLGELPPISVKELAEHMKEAEEAFYSLESLQVEATERQVMPPGSPLAPPSSVATSPGPAKPKVRVTRSLYRMRDQLGKEYLETAYADSLPFGPPVEPVAPKDPQRMLAYNGKVYMAYRPHRLGITYKRPKELLLARTGLRNLYGIGLDYSHVADVTAKGPTWQVTFLPSEQYEGNECYVVSCDYQPKPGGPIYPVRKRWICPDLGYAVVRWQDRKLKGKVEWDNTFHDFTECAPGVWLPGSYEVTYSGSTPSNTSYRFTYSRVNEHIHLDEFKVYAPPGTTVKDRRFGKGWIPHWRDLLAYGFPTIVLVIAICRSLYMKEPRRADN